MLFPCQSLLSALLLFCQEMWKVWRKLILTITSANETTLPHRKPRSSTALSWKTFLQSRTTWKCSTVWVAPSGNWTQFLVFLRKLPSYLKWSFIETYSCTRASFIGGNECLLAEWELLSQKQVSLQLSVLSGLSAPIIPISKECFVILIDLRSAYSFTSSIDHLNIKATSLLRLLWSVRVAQL